MLISTDPGSVSDSPTASRPSESVHITAGKKVLKRAIKTKTSKRVLRATKIKTGPKDGMCLN